MAFQFFVSYAHNDNVPPIEGEGKGFVSTLVKYLEHRFTILGEPRPVIWRDAGTLRPSDQFDPVIEKGLADSNALVVIFSNNWLHSEYCKKELILFREQRRTLSDAEVKRRIILVAKHFLPHDARPPLLAGQQSHEFFEPDEEFRGKFVDLFELGAKQQSKQFGLAVEQLAEDLWDRAKNPAPTPDVKPAEPKTGGGKKRTIYLAKPAKDMRWAYERLVDELEGKGYAVAPGRDVKLPDDDLARAADFVNEAIAKAECSIHLIGEKSGPVIDEEEAGLTLQLRAAAARSAETTDGTSVFKRIIWAPEILRDEKGNAVAEARDPQALLERYASFMPTDTLHSLELSDFVEFVIKHLAENRPAIDVPQFHTLSPDAHVYILADEKDADYAIEVADSLSRRNIRPELPVWDDESEREAHEKEQLATCDAVVIAWANKGRRWVNSTAEQFKDWAALGRDKEFAVRSVVEGFPASPDKKAFKRLPPPEIDVVVDLTAHGEPPLPPESFEPLFKDAQ